LAELMIGHLWIFFFAETKKSANKVAGFLEERGSYGWT
jgi:hypothetical protein